MKAKELGIIGEKIATEELSKKGYRIVCRNFSFQKAEVDIVAEYDDKIVFIEVKTRQSAYLSDPSLLLSRGKQKQIIKAADEYVKLHTPLKPYRFDLVIVIKNKDYQSVEHIMDAFYPMV